MAVHQAIGESVEAVEALGAARPEVGVVLGSGLGDFSDRLSHKTVCPYEEIPHFRKTRVPGHAGELALGRIAGRPCALLNGRYHYYEGHDMTDVIYPVRVLCALGIRVLVLTNAAGGINPAFRPGDLMIIRDHLNLMGVNPLRGENDEKLGPRFPDLSAVYDPALVDGAAGALKSLGSEARTGVYAAVAGPSYETPAEVKMLAGLGADAVGMSTVPEAIAARHMGVKVAGISCITNLAAGLSRTPLDHREVTETASRVKGPFHDLLSRVISLCP